LVKRAAITITVEIPSVLISYTINFTNLS